MSRYSLSWKTTTRPELQSETFSAKDEKVARSHFAAMRDTLEADDGQWPCSVSLRSPSGETLEAWYSGTPGATVKPTA